MIILFIISIVLVLAYVGFAIWSRRGLPESISLRVYSLPKGYRRWLWSLWLWSETMLFSPALFFSVPEEHHAAAHLFVTSQLMTAFVPLIKSRLNDVHISLVTLSCGFSQLCALIMSPCVLLSWIPVLMAIPFVSRGRKAFLFETESWLTVMMCIILKLTAV